MTRALFWKELRQHGVAFLALGGLLMIGLWGIVGNPLMRRALGSGFDGLALLLKALVPLGALVLSSLLIAAEFRHKTQLFLEGLPLPRWRVLAAKYALMMGALMGAAGLALVAAWWRGRGGEAMTPGFAALLAAKTAAWTWFVGSVLFALGFLGRYRIALGAITALALVWMNSAEVLDLGRHAPFSLLDDRFAYEREVWPIGALLLTCAWAGVLSGFGFSLGLVRDATVASLLAEKMSAREKAWVTLGLVAVMIAIGFEDERRKHRETVNLPGSFLHEPAAGVRLEISSALAPSPEETAALTRTGTNLATALVEFAGALDGSLPPLFLVHRADLAGDDIQDGELAAQQGVLVRANVTATNLNPQALERAMIRLILKARTRGRSEKEPWAWMAEGFPHWWTSRTNAARGLAADPALASRAKEAQSAAPLTRGTFTAWFSLREAVSGKGAEALSWAALQTVSQRHGSEVVCRLLRECFGRPITEDARAWLGDLLDPPEQRLRRAAGMNFDQLAQAVGKELADSSAEAKP